MNVLAHLHLAMLSGSDFTGNIAADFIKGDPYKQYSKAIAQGVMLHRRIDAITDALPEVRLAKKLFSPSNQRLAPITLDILWDHFLSKHWCDFVHIISLPAFNQLSFDVIDPQINQMPEPFQRFMHYLWQDNWLLNYADLDFMRQVLSAMAKRRPKLAALSDTFSDIELHYNQLEILFRTFYPRFCNMAIHSQL